MFPTSWSDASSSEDEENWPPPGRRRRHPAGNSYETASTCSDASQSCISRLLGSPCGVDIQKESAKLSGGLFSTDVCSQGVWEMHNECSVSTEFSSGFYSQPPTQSVGRLTASCLHSSNPVENPKNNPDELTARFGYFSLDENLRSEVHTESISTPPMLRRFLNSHAPSPTECSYSCPSRSYGQCTNNGKSET
ncbi:unnamed protein product [Dicrocoelium dendriticum]|nr:unnamed protein product [Dicrocoelium dendriticum]